jgi:phosphatidate cytidylyltransferase
MIETIYLIALSYFLLGGIGFYFITRKKEPDVARKSYIKFLSYFVIINLLFFSIVIFPVAFRVLSIIIIGTGFIELFRLFRKSGYDRIGFFLLSVSIYTVLSIGFFLFGGLEKELILFSFLVVSIFDSFSQISGQLWGRRKIFPKISPNKTVGGLIGGSIIAICSAFLLNGLYTETPLEVIIMIFGVLVFAFSGDIAASFYKRKYKVKNYSNLIPGHGGFLDRFDSLIAGGAWVFLFVYILNH